MIESPKISPIDVTRPEEDSIVYFIDLEGFLTLMAHDGTYHRVQGTDGISAYQVAVDNGFVGSEEAWLESLVGTPGQPGTDGKSFEYKGAWVSGNTYSQFDTSEDTSDNNVYWKFSVGT